MSREDRRFRSGLVRNIDSSDTKLTRQIPWLRVFVEGTVIVASILLAFGIDAWWEGRQEEVRASEHLAALLDDVAANLQDVDEATRDTENVLAAARSARSLFASGWTDVPADSVLRLVILAAAIDVHQPVTGAYDQLVSTGDMRLISRDVRDALSIWQSALLEVTAYSERNVLDFRKTSLLPYWMEAVAVGEMVSLFRTGDPVRFSNDLALLATDRQLDNLLMMKLLMGGDQLLTYERLRAALVELEAHLEQATRS